MSLTILPSTPLQTGSTAESSVIDLTSEGEFVLRVTVRGDGLQDSHIRLIVEDQSGGVERSFSTHSLQGLGTLTVPLLSPPPKIRVRVECLLGPVVIEVVRVLPSLPLNPPNLVLVDGAVLYVSNGSISLLPPPPPLHSMGTNASGVLGYYPTSLVSGGHTHVWNEVPGGLINGVNRVFSLQNQPNPLPSLLLFKNGLLMKSGEDYVLSGTSVEFDPGQTPAVGDNLLVSYTV